MTRRRAKYIEQTNPLRSLSPVAVASMLENGIMGNLTQLQWAYYIIEQSDPDLIALVERRTSAIRELDWNIKTVDCDDDPARQAMAERQAATLRAAYDAIGNLYDVFEHLALASFRGYAIGQLQRVEGETSLAWTGKGPCNHIECLDTWSFVRDGLFGSFKWNPTAAATTFESLPDTNLIAQPGFLIRHVKRSIDRVGIVKFVRSNYSQKAWADFIETCAEQGVVVIGPPGAGDKETEYKAAAEAVSRGDSGYLPNGSAVEFANGQRGPLPFEGHMRFLREQLILAGTGGMLTMLAEPTGIGQGASGAHQDTFKAIARAEARNISETFQKQFDALILAQAHAGEPMLAYFDLAANEEQDVGEILDHAVKIKQAGGQVDWDEISEKTGYTITAAPEPPAFPPGGGISDFGSRISNRAAEAPAASLVDQAVSRTETERAAIVEAWFAQLEALSARGDLPPAQYLDAAEALVRAMPAALMTRENIDRLARIGEGAMGGAIAQAAIAELGRKSESRSHESESGKQNPGGGR